MDIAVIGVAFRLPGGILSWESLMSALANSQSLVRDIPETRFLFPSDFLSKYGQIKGVTQAGLINDVSAFDPAFFGMSPAEAALMDPQHRWALMLVWEALGSARIRPSSLAGSLTSVAVASCSYDYRELLSMYPEQSRSAKAVTGTYLSMLSNRVSYMLDIKGPSETIDTACSGGLVSLHRSCEWLRTGQADLALSGAVHFILTPTNSMALATANFLSRQGRLLAFDAHADGYVRGEGSMVFVLKRLEDAWQDGDPIHAVIKGSAIGHGGRGHSLTAPQSSAQAAVIQSALSSAKLGPNDVDVIECHGTGTKLGDPIEVAGINIAFHTRSVNRPLCLTTVKPFFGHLEAAAGTAGMLGAMAVFKSGNLHGLPGTTVLNPLLEICHQRLQINTQTSLVPVSDDRPLRIGVSSFGFGGVNAHLILERPIQRTAADFEPGEVFVFPISSKSEYGLNRYWSMIREWLSKTDPSRWWVLQDYLMYDNDYYQHRALIVLSNQDDLLRVPDQIGTGDMLMPASVDSQLLTPAVNWLDGVGYDWPNRTRPKSTDQMPGGFVLSHHWIV